MSSRCSEQKEPEDFPEKTTIISCQLENLNENDINHTEEVIIGSEQGTTFPTKIGITMCNALIDTGDTRCCMSEKYYKKLHLAKIHLLQNINAKSATGSNLSPVGLVNCTFELGKTKLRSDFIVCKNLTRPLILGRDFLIQNHVSIKYSENKKCILDYQQQELIASLNVEDKPASMILPGRILAIIQVNNYLEPKESGQIYEIEPNNFLTEQYPNLYIVPMIHNMDVHKTENVPLVIINFLVENISLLKGEIMGFMQNQSLDISEIVTETSTEPPPILLQEDNDIEGLQDQKEEIVSESKEKKFITSPADIEVHQKIELQDANVSEEQQNTFKELCNEFKDIFSVDSSDIRKTFLIEMEVETWDSPPITQKPYILPLKHAMWVQKELEILEKAGVRVRSVLPWASPIVIVPKRTAPGEPPKRRLCVDYRAINSLLPHVKKALSKAKGVLPKIDEIYA